MFFGFSIDFFFFLSGWQLFLAFFIKKLIFSPRGFFFCLPVLFLFVQQPVVRALPTAVFLLLFFYGLQLDLFCFLLSLAYFGGFFEMFLYGFKLDFFRFCFLFRSTAFSFLFFFGSLSSPPGDYFWANGAHASGASVRGWVYITHIYVVLYFCTHMVGGWYYCCCTATIAVVEHGRFNGWVRYLCLSSF